MVNVPSRSQAPNHKYDHFFSHLIQIYTKALEPGCIISSDKQDTSLQIHHEDKERVTFKRAGDGFFIDENCEDGYTINSYTGNVPPTKKCIENGYLPTHS